MATIGPLSPASGADDASVGTLTWADPGNVVSDNATYAVAGHAILSATRYTHYLRMDFADAGLPLGATSISIAFALQRKKTNSFSTVKDYVVQLHDNGTPIGANDADTVTPWAEIEATADYDGADGTWGVTKTDGEWRTLLNSGTFGVMVQASILYEDPGEVDPATAEVDYGTITITYTAGSGDTRILTGVAMSPRMQY